MGRGDRLAPVSYALVAATAFLVTFVATPLARRLSLRVGWIDHPSDRKVHPAPTATAGGIAILAGAAAALLAAPMLPDLGALADGGTEIRAALLAGVAIAALGLLDDVRGLSAGAKLAGQVLCAGLVVLSGVQLLFFYVPGQGVVSLDPTLAIPLSVLWIIAMVNAVNLIDGLDGLAAGMVAIGAIAFLVYMRAPAGSEVPSAAAVVSAAAAGAALGFLPWNFHPARVFMGDTGALLLGLLLGVATIAGIGRNPYPPAGGDLAVIAIPIALPLLVLALPFTDVVLAIGRRIRQGRGVTRADKEHLHHRLLDIGHTHRGAVLLLYLWSALISGCALAIAFLEGWRTVGLVVAASIAVGAVIPWWALRRSDRRAGTREEA